MVQNSGRINLAFPVDERAVRLLMTLNELEHQLPRSVAARIEITPTQPVTLAGYASRTNLYRSVHDPLSARAVAFAHGDRKLVLVSVDSLGFYNGTADPVRQAILDTCGSNPPNCSSVPFTPTVPPR